MAKKSRWAGLRDGRAKLVGRRPTLQADMDKYSLPKLSKQRRIIALIMALSPLLLTMSCAINSTPSQIPTVPSPTSLPTSIMTMTLTPSLLARTISPSTTIAPTITPTNTLTPTPTSILNTDANYLKEGKIALLVPDLGIGVMNADGSDFRLIIDSSLDPAQKQIFKATDSITWSPDGQWLAYDQVVDLENFHYSPSSQIFVMKADGSDKKQITNYGGYKWGLAWSPDGQEIAYSDTGNILAVQKDGKYVRELANLPGIMADFPSWSPDGTRMAFITEKYVDPSNEGFRLNVMDLSTGIPKRIVDLPTTHSGINWSPDGKYIAFSSPEPDNSSCVDLYIIRISDNDLKRLGNGLNCQYLNPAWSPDSQYIAFPADNFRVGLMKSDGTDYVPLTSSIPSKNFGFLIAWSQVPGLRIGQSYSTTALSGNLILYQGPSSKESQVAIIKPGSQVTVLSEAMDAENYYWRKVRLEDNTEGFVKEVGGWFAPVK